MNSCFSQARAKMMSLFTASLATPSPVATPSIGKPSLVRSQESGVDRAEVDRRHLVIRSDVQFASVARGGY